LQRVEDAAGDELEARVALDDGFAGSVRDDEHRDAEAGVVSPAVDHVVHRAPDDPGSAFGEHALEVFLVDGRRRAARAVVGPRAAEHPLVQALAALAEAGPQPVAGAGDVAVERDRDTGDHACHRATYRCGSAVVSEFPAGSRCLDIGGTGTPQPAVSSATS